MSHRLTLSDQLLADDIRLVLDRGQKLPDAVELLEHCRGPNDPVLVMVRREWVERLTRERWSAPEIAARVGVSERLVHRDLAALREAGAADLRSGRLSGRDRPMALAGV